MSSRIKQAAAATAICATVAAMIGIAAGAAAPSKKSSGPSPGALREFPAPPPGAKGLRLHSEGPRPIGGPPVHSELVVPNKSGDDFVTITQDSGEVVSVSGSEITVKEGTEEATYKTVTLDLPDGATVVRNGEKVEIGDLQTGDQVHVSQSPENSFVFAIDSQHQKLLMHRHFKFRRGLQAAPGLPPGPPPVPFGRHGN
jgi:hypothetical protein